MSDSFFRTVPKYSGESFLSLALMCWGFVRHHGLELRAFRLWRRGIVKFWKISVSTGPTRALWQRIDALAPPALPGVGQSKYPNSFTDLGPNFPQSHRASFSGRRESPRPTRERAGKPDDLVNFTRVYVVVIGFRNVAFFVLCLKGRHYTQRQQQGHMTRLNLDSLKGYSQEHP